MADLRIKRMEVRNWARFRNVSLELPESGLVTVIGVNHASEGAMDSNGSGKTALCEALCRTLFGIPGRFTHLKEYSTDEKGDTYVRVEAEFLGKPLIVESGYRYKPMSSTGEALRFTYDGEVVERGIIGQTRTALCALLGVQPLLAAWTVYIDGDNTKFNRIPQAERMALVISALRQPSWTVYHERAKKLTAKLKRQEAQEEALHGEATRRLKAAQSGHATAKESYEEAVACSVGIADRRKRQKEAMELKKAPLQSAIEKILKRRKAITKELAEIERNRASEQHKLEIARNEASDALDALNEQLIQLQSEETAANNLYVQAKERKTSYAASAKECPTCGAVRGTPIDATRMANLSEAVSVHAQKLTSAQAVVNDMRSKITSAKSVYTRACEALNQLSAGTEIRDLSREDRTLEQDLADYQQDLADIDARIADVDKDASHERAVIAAKATFDEKQRVLLQAETELETVAQTLTEASMLVRASEYWLRAFSPAGIPNMVLRESVGPLNSESVRMSKLITGGTISVTYSTSRTLASDEDKPELNVTVDNSLGSRKLEGNSKGEAGTVNFVIGETLASIGQTQSRIGFRWFDEVLNPLDAKVRGSVLAYLKEMSQKHGVLVFVADHSSETSNYADHVLVVEKMKTANGVESTVRWQS